MQRITVNDLTMREKMRLICAKGFWYTEDFDGKLPSVCVSDGPCGLRAERTNDKGEKITVPSVAYPCPQSVANSWDDECARAMGECLAADCREQNVDILLAPGVNIKRHPLNGRNFEYFSEDPLLAGRMAKAYIEGLQASGTGACLKHFCCNNLEYNRFNQSSEIDERTLRELYYVPFEIACQAKPVSAMCAYNRVNGRYASENKKGFAVLRDEFGFDGAMYSDWEAVRDRTQSAKAGCDIEFPYNEENFKRLQQDHAAGKISDEEIDACAARVLALAYRCADMRRNRGKNAETREERLATAQRIAAESMVLLKNDDGILPLKKGESVCAAGCYAKPESGMIAGDGSSRVVPITKDWDILPLLEQKLGVRIPFDGMFYYDKVLGTNGYGAYTAKPMDARTHAANANVSLIFCGTGAPFEYESFDRPHMKLPLAQERAILDLAAVNPQTVVVLFAGSPIDVSAWEGAVKGIVYAGFCGERGIHALADILCGDVNPSGKLSETFPVCWESSPVSRTYSDAMVTCYQEGLNVGYRYYDRHPEAVRYPFGYGLSYARFAYDDLRAELSDDGVKVTFTLSNVSHVDGKEVAQVYVRECSPVVYRPVKELRGYAKTEVRAGEKKTVTVFLNERAFAYYSVADDGWRINGGTYRILVGGSAQDIRLQCSVCVPAKERVLTGTV